MLPQSGPRRDDVREGANHDVEVRLSPMPDDVGAASMVLHSQFAPQVLDLRSRAGDHPWRVR